MKACFEKMGIASEDAQKWLEEFSSVSFVKEECPEWRTWELDI